MKVFFDTNVHVAAALLGDAAERMLAATAQASWRSLGSEQVLEEVERVLVERLDCSRRFARLTRRRVARRVTLVSPTPSRHQVPADPNDTPILQAAIGASADLLVTNDPHLLSLSPYEGLRILSMSDYYALLQESGLLP